MSTYHSLIITLILIAFIAIKWRIYLQSKLEGNQYSFLSLFNKNTSIRYLFLLSGERFGEENISKVKQANRATIVFYVAFLGAILIGLITEVIKP